MRHVATTAMAAATMTSSLAYAQPAVPPAMQSVIPQAGEEVSHMISRPKTPVEFARNLKFIFDHDLLLQDEYYTETNLKDIFNLGEVGLFKDNDGSGNRRISVSSSHFVSIFPWVPIPGRTDFTPTAQLTAGRTIHDDGSIKAGVNFSMFEGGPDFAATQRIFGDEFIRLTPTPSPHGGPLPATAPHGNETWKRHWAEDKTEKSTTIGFNPAGQLDAVIIEIDKR
ncbi:hypothetical protein AWB68_00054 [Caballeronia choica]|uniref:Uncharacterized protein n=1 Tax=Caballeronia choica TaxID=326476 RepID=A0A158EW95_9BURK|nr:hypothetical protein [Caballeronia choica]SAL11831.1 hypothetical protein AWB68_00054 [Caballeronia choica]